MKDYYKILDVPRTAPAKEIKVGYRKKAQEWHPDKYSGPLPEDQVLLKMSEINSAYEVLSDKGTFVWYINSCFFLESRRRYDQGYDPNDPNQQQDQGFPFQGGFPGGFQFGGQGQHFTFHFG